MNKNISDNVLDQFWSSRYIYGLDISEKNLMQTFISR